MRARKSQSSPSRPATRLGPAKPAVLVLGIGLLRLAQLAAGACLPDLSALSRDAEAPTVSCGDHFIDELDGESCDPGDAGAEGAVPGCAGCQTTCEGDLDPSTGHCYFTTNATSDYETAVRQCELARAHLVTLGSQAEFTRVAQLGFGSFWVGMTIQGSRGGYVAARFGEPGWPLGGSSCPGCFAIADDAGAFPQGPGGGSECLVAQGAQWLGVPCRKAETWSTVCEREIAGQRSQTCTGGLCFTRPTSSYLIVGTPVTAAEAATACTGFGTLVILDSVQKRESLVDELIQIGGEEQALRLYGISTFWVGLAFNGSEWVWDDAVTVAARPIPWGADQPRGLGASRAYLNVDPPLFDAALLRSFEDGEPEGDDVKRPYVCERR